MEWMFMPLRRYAEFSGRSRRMEYWMYQLMMTIIGVVFLVIALIVMFGAVGLASRGGGDGSGALSGLTGLFASFGILAIIGLLVFLALFIPSLAVQVRRLHDTNRSGWWIMLYYGPYLLSLVIGVVAAASQASSGEPNVGLTILNLLVMLVFYGGWITLTVFDCLPGTPGPNKYGPDPLGGAGDLAQTFQ